MTDTVSMIRHLNVKLALLGYPPVATDGTSEFNDVIAPLVARYREKERLLGAHLCPADQRIQNFLYDYFQDDAPPSLPTRTFTLDRPGMARLLSLPLDRDEFVSDIVSSYRVKQGVLHNPRSDRRTTQGIFHVAEGGLPIPADKAAVPKAAAAKLFALALKPPQSLLRLPFTASQPNAAEGFVSLLLRPLVCPAVAGLSRAKTMEVRFFAPGNLVSNLDFVETIFGNAGDPDLPENDAGLDVEHWTGHTGCVILAPHLATVTKKEAGLPSWQEATPKQRRDGMCWKDEHEFYNDGRAFKLTCRDQSGVIVTVIADNYFGYCKKEVKTQISYAANLFGGCEEEHAGGALVFPCYDLGEEFSGNVHVQARGHSYEEMIADQREIMEPQPEGYAIDKAFPDIFYVPKDATFDLRRQRITWQGPNGQSGIKLLPGRTYVRPSGYHVRMEKPAGNRPWRLIGTVSEGIFCHKPCTVSGGGKSEISKPISDAILHGPVYVADMKEDFDRVAELIDHDYSRRFRDPKKEDRRAFLSQERSLGSVIKLLTPDRREYTDAYNVWLESIPQYLKELAFMVKRFYKAAWGAQWREHFSVDIINGTPANELKCDNRKLMTTYLRVGFDEDGSWRTFGLRKDFCPAAKLQQEDDISASMLVPLRELPELAGSTDAVAVKFVANCEARLFQRPDDAVHRGYDRITEADFARSNNFFSNYEPLTPGDARDLVDEAIGFYQFTEPMQRMIRSVAANGKVNYFVSPSHPRLVEGKPTRNPRYLQVRPDLLDPKATHLAEIGARLQRRLKPGQRLLRPVGAVLPGRRNNPPDDTVRSLAVYNPIHYFELPELFMEFICSMTGKSPSTTGAGSEGALTKGPFNALPPVIDLNAALVDWLLTGQDGFVTAAGYVGPRVRVDHDISLLVPEVWCRMGAAERAPKFLIENGYLDKCEDFEHAGRRVLASRLGYRINEHFVHAFFGRIFNHPGVVFTDAMLRPELQGIEIFVDGVDNVVTTQKRVAQMYFEDGSVAWACPPLQALLHIMAEDSWQGKGLEHPDVRRLFTREALLSSDWYAARLSAKQRVDVALWRKHVAYLERFRKKPSYAEEVSRLGIPARLASARAALQQAETPEYLQNLVGTLGAEPLEHIK
ncbi:MAG TPA: hypothetical protein VG167_06520 [Verrucomicrobiae bacterium]|nr:hypothetical protein [Verrucomicrobiae bacterium]